MVNSKIKGSTLVEVVVSLTIITVIFWLNMMVFHNLNKNSNLQLRSKALLLAGGEINQTISNNTLIDEEDVIEGIKLVKRIREYDENLHEVIIKAFDTNDRLILQKRRLVYVP